ncbi:MAG: hypothetical protein U5K29_00885 [Acidimicrobiales bacterium]|nr:hypothetical protein [Acidimicrobiales bacterium]
MLAPYLAAGAPTVRQQPTHDPTIVIVLSDDDPGQLTPEAMESLVARLQAAPELDAVGPLASVVDAHKVIDDEGQVVETLDRSTLAHLGRPAAVRRQALESGEINRIGRW